jgi:Lipase (class 3)
MKKLVLFFWLSIPAIVWAQLSPGFDKAEYIELMKVSARTSAEENYYKKIAEPQRFKMMYQSPVIGLENLWDLWNDGKGTAVLSIRGTTTNATSWLANFYAAMVPAKGQLQLSTNDVFEYELASNPKAAVHVGWLVSTAFITRDMLPKIDSTYKSGTKDMIIVGHSQGGGIAYLVTAYLYNQQKTGKLPADIRFKTYCSAGPKPGNLYFAHEYEAMTHNGWAYNVVNAADWVPEVPISIQTLSDFNLSNPFIHAKGIIKKQKFPTSLALKYMYNQLSKPPSKAQKRYQKYLGSMTSKTVQKTLPGFVPPAYYASNHYVRTGNMIVLLPDDDYFKLYPESQSADNMFPHHLHPQYMYLAEKLK